ncbi:hypothetical protein BOX15_Mlig009362g5, partial [Macrostomum lignano]
KSHVNLAAMRVWERSHVFEHSWETVVEAAMNKYPNPMFNGVLSQDVVSRSVSKDGILRTHRLFGLLFTGVVHRLTNLGFYRLFNSLIDLDVDVWYGSEHTMVDPRARSYLLHSKNITFSRGITLEERLEYKPHPDNPTERTVLQQSARICCPWWPIGGLVETILEDFVYDRMAAKGPRAIEWVIANRIADTTADASS